MLVYVVTQITVLRSKVVKVFSAREDALVWMRASAGEVFEEREQPENGYAVFGTDGGFHVVEQEMV